MEAEMSYGISDAPLMNTDKAHISQAMPLIMGLDAVTLQQRQGEAGLSLDVVAAAHGVLVNCFPAQQSALDSQYSASLAGITTDSGAKNDGVAVGEAAAQAVIAARMGDGLEANVPYTPRVGARRVDSDASRLCPSRDSMVRTDAAVYNEGSRRFSAGLAALAFQRDLCKRLQSDALLWRT